MTSLALLAFSSALLVIFSLLLAHLNYKLRCLLSSAEKDLKESLDLCQSFKKDYDGLEQRLKASQQEYTDLQSKFQKNPSYECQQLLASLLNGHALFHIETIDPENIFIRRR